MTGTRERTGPIDRRPGLGIGSAAVAASAFAGAVGLMTGTLALTDHLAARLPFGSPVVGGVALALIVGVPFSALAASTRWRADLSDRLAVGAGLLLVAWIVVELVVVRSFSPLQPFFLLVGAAVAVAGWHTTPRRSATYRSTHRSARPMSPGGHAT